MTTNNPTPFRIERFEEDRPRADGSKSGVALIGFRLWDDAHPVGRPAVVAEVYPAPHLVDVSEQNMKRLAQLPVLEARDAAAPATRTMLDLSTEHISAHTASYLDQMRHSCYPKGEYGWFLHVADEVREDDPADLRAVLDFARERGFDWIMLDCDGDVQDGLPTF